MRLVFLISILISSVCQGQVKFLEGTWQGILTHYGEAYKDGIAVWFDFQIDATTGEMKGESRLEEPFKPYFAYKNIKGKAEDRNHISFEDVIIGNQESAFGKVWCMQEGDLVYDDSTGYLTGSWKSPDCRSQSGQLILYRSKYNLSRTDTASLYHSWFNNFVGDLSRGWKAWYVRDAEMRNFEFIPVYFDHDKDDLKPEFEPYLKKMVKIVLSHTDLRIKIIGHTDSNGSDDYNVGLSQRRAERVRDFLIAQGLKPDRIIIEYRGEKDPAVSNETLEGKSLNRRVDFEFI